VIELMIKESHLAPDAAVEGYELSMTRPGWIRKRRGSLNLEGFKNVLKLRAEVEGQWAGIRRGRKNTTILRITMRRWQS